MRLIVRVRDAKISLRFPSRAFVSKEQAYIKAEKLKKAFDSAVSVG